MSHVLVLTVALALTAAPAGASTAESTTAEGDALRIVPVRPFDTVASTHESRSRALWTWPEARKAFVIGDHFRSLYMVDLDSREILARRALEFPYYYIDPEFYGGRGHEFSGALDTERGLVFVPFVSRPPGIQDVPDFGSLTTVDPISANTEQILEHQSLCVSVTAFGMPCFGGLTIYDADDLSVVGTLPVEQFTADGTSAAQLLLRRVQYLPPQPDMGWGGRVVVLVEEVRHSVGEDTAIKSGNENVIARRNGGALAYAIQFDPESQRQEWAVRLEGCRNSRERRGSAFDQHPDPMAVYRVGGPQPEMVVGCHGTSTQTGVALHVPLDGDGRPATLPVRGAEVTGAPPDSPDEGAPPPAPVAASPRQRTVFGPDSVVSIMADPVSQRLLYRAVDGQDEVWWVYDAVERAFSGTIGIGVRSGSGYAVDTRRGRLYVLTLRTVGGGFVPDALFLADFRRSPLPQALQFTDTARRWDVKPEFERVYLDDVAGIPRLLTFDSRSVLEDHVPVSVGVAEEGQQRRSLDLEEAAEVTASTLDGVARGFGVRAIFLGGLEGAARVGPVDPIGVFSGALRDLKAGPQADPALEARPQPDGCSSSQREIVLAFAGPDSAATVDGSGARGSAQPLVIDGGTRGDVEAPVSRCHAADLTWQRAWESALFGRPPAAEPSAPWMFDDSESSCVSTDEDRAESWSDPVVSRFSSSVECDDETASGWAQSRMVDIDGVSVSSTLSQFMIYRDPYRGIVSRVESIARGVDIGGTIEIDTIRGVAESWANGRSNKPTTDESALNCDRERSAGTCYQRHILGARITNPADGAALYRCGPCGDEEALTDAINSALGASGSARLRDPDPALARGSDDGYIAAIQRPESERYADMILNADRLPTLLPALEITRNAPQGRPGVGATRVLGTGPRGKQIVQFAGVEVSSSYGIQCLLLYDETANTCSEGALATGSLTVSLTDLAGAPLTGGAFEVRRDGDADGVVGLVDELVGDGACLTATDGVGTCTFENLQPGAYLVSQMAAPAGYAAVAEPWLSEVAAGEARTVTFTNTTDISTIEVSATDEAGEPVEGAVFAVFADPDADGKIAPHTAPAATCTTDASGVCTMAVPAGSYVLVQTGAPDGLTAIDPVAFAFASGGQTAAVAVTNTPTDPATPDAPGAQAAPVTYTAPPALSPTDDAAPYAPPPAASEQAGPNIAQQTGGTIVQVIRAPGDVLRLLARDPKQAVAWTAALALFAVAMMVVRRRQMLGALIAVPALASSGAQRPQAPAGPAAPLRATALKERGTIAGAAPAPAERADVTVLAATASEPLSALVAQRLAATGNCELTATATTMAELRRALPETMPDVLLIDLTMTADDLDGLLVTLATLHPPRRTVGLIAAGDGARTRAERAAAAGIGGLLLVADDLGNGQLAYAVRNVAADKLCYGPGVQTLLMEHFLHPAPPADPDVPYLTNRELDVLRLSARGLRRADIAKRLFISEETVKTHLRRGRERLSVANPRDHRELRRRLDELGLLED